MIVGRHRRADWVLFAALLAGACGGSKKIETGEACTLNSDCRNPLSCSYGKCHETCVATRDCPLGSSCVMTSAGGVCQLPDEADCRTTGVCAPGLFCAVDFRCRTVCQGSAACTTGQVCVGGVCAEPGDVDTTGNLPVKNPGASTPGQGGAGGTNDCVVGPGGYCWSLWQPKTATSPAAVSSWVTAPTSVSAHFTASSGVDTTSGAGIALRKGSAAVDLGQVDQVWFDADVAVGQEFSLSFATEVAGNDPGPSCTWQLFGKGKTRYVVDLESAHYCYPTACGFDRSTATSLTLNSAGWQSATVDINVTGIGFSTTGGTHSPITTSGEAGQGPNGWCTSLITWGTATASWLARPTTSQAQVLVNNPGGGGTGGPQFELPPAQRNLSGVIAIEFDADIQTEGSSAFAVQLNDMFGANSQYDKVTAVGPQTYVVSLATPTTTQTGQGHSYDRTNVHDIKIGSRWNVTGQSTFKITRLALKSGIVVGPVVIPDAGVAGPVDARPATTGADAAPTAAGTVLFSDGRARGLLSGYGYAALSAKDILTSPTCDTGKLISQADPCTTMIMWSRTDALCMSGSIPALPASPAQTDYDSNWGMQIGVNANEPSDAVGSVMADYKTVTFTLTGKPSSGLRAFLYRHGDPDTTTYCVDSIKSGTPISLTKFNTKCWGDATTVNLTLDDLPKIEKMGVQVSSTSSAEIAVSDLCLEKIEFAK